VIARARIVVTMTGKRGRGTVGEERRLRHAGPARGKVGHSLAAPVSGVGQRRARAPGGE
jgi:hypothetical protein